jgi:hypothetical protein
MVAPLPPKVVGPVSELSTSILVEGQVTGATVTVYEDNTQVAGGPAPSASFAFPLLPNKTLTAGQKLTATATDAQTKETSVRSPQPVIVIGKPKSLSTVSFRFNQFLYGQYVILDGLWPGAEAQVFHGNTLVGKRVSPGNSIGVILTGLSAALGAGESLTAIQVAGKMQSISKTGPKAEVLPIQGDQIPPPVIKQPLYACQSSIELTGLFNGAHVTLTRQHGQIVLHQAGWIACKTDATFILSSPLVDGEKLTIRQEFPLSSFQGIDSPPYPVVTAKPTPPPAVMGPICMGASSVTLTQLVPGAHVFISVHRMVGQSISITPLGEGEVKAGKTIEEFYIPPIPPGPGTNPTVTASQALCGALSVDAKPVPINALAKSLSQPNVPAPLYECATVVHVDGITPGATVVVRSQQAAGDISATQRIYAPSADILVVSLNKTDGIYAVETGCDQTKNVTSNVQPVQALPSMLPRPAVAAPVTVMMQAVTVTQVLPGAQVTVFVDNLWRNAVTAGSSTVTVPVGALHLKDQIKAQQTLCQAGPVFSDPIVFVTSGKMQLTVTPGIVQSGVAVALTIHLQDADSKLPIGGATITIDNQKAGVTAANGSLSVQHTFPKPGMAAVRASASGFLDAYFTLQVLNPVMPGYSGIDIYNCNVEKSTISVWVFDHSLGQMSWRPAGTQTSQFNSDGYCPYTEQNTLDSPFTVDNLKTNVKYDIAIVDPNLIGCGVDDPTKQACLRKAFTVQGDENGSRLQLFVS